MKILIVAGWMYPDAEGGSFRVVYEAGRRLAARGHEVHVLTQQLDPLCPAEQVIEGMRVHRYRTTASSGLRFALSTYRAVRRAAKQLQGEFGFDVVHTHHPVSAFAALRARALRRVPVVATLHSLAFLERLDRRTQGRAGLRFAGPAALFLLWMDGFILNRSRRIVVLSDFTRGLLAKFFPQTLARVVKLPGGADLEHFRPEPSRGEARSRLRLPSGGAIFFTCRRLEHRMGLSELVEATGRLKQQGRNVLTLIAGRGSLDEALRQQVREQRLEDSVRLLGYVAEGGLPLYYRAADCFVLPTRALEGFGLVTAEALACGTPVLGTPVGATPEILQPFDPRLLTRDATAEGLAEGMARFLDEVAAEPGLEQRCRAYAEQHLSWDAFVDGLERISREVAHQ
ncbi:MAG TPA: glycosyltransferase family 4 protein [Planctomycetota bacterium]|nr:glycosyltransferase family 4 protein [Planctomycetota bacterium]